MNKIVVTGATGMIGIAIIEEALKQNIKVVCIIHKNSTRILNIPDSYNIQIIKADLSEYEYLIPVITDCDAIIHLACDKTFGSSRDDVDIQVKNIQYTLDAVRLAKKMSCSVFVGAGSQAEYGPVSCDLTSSTPTNPESGYGIAKYTAGKLSSLLCNQLDMRQNWVRILSIYGKNDAAHTLISYVIDELKEGNSPELTKCEQTWDYLNCEDAAKGILAIAKSGINGKAYPLGSGNGKKLSEYIEIIKNIINPEIKIKYGLKDYYPHQPMHLVADISELTQDTGWIPKISFED